MSKNEAAVITRWKLSIQVIMIMRNIDYPAPAKHRLPCTCMVLPLLKWGVILWQFGNIISMVHFILYDPDFASCIYLVFHKRHYDLTPLSLLDDQLSSVGLWITFLNELINRKSVSFCNMIVYCILFIMFFSMIYVFLNQMNKQPFVNLIWWSCDNDGGW